MPPAVVNAVSNNKTVTSGNVTNKDFKYSDVTATEKDESQFLTVIRGKVYDLSNFVARHPGGDVIRLAAGRDASILFESYHPRGMASKLAPFQIGTCQDAPCPKQQDSAFYNTVTERVEKYLQDNNKARQMTAASLVELFVVLSLAATSYYYSATFGSAIGAACLGLMYGRLGFIMHMGNHHGAASRHYSWLNKVHGACMDLMGASSTIWRFDHNIAHHCTPNELNSDNDCEIGNPMYRFHPGLKRHWWHAAQALTIAMGMSIGLVKWIFQDVVNAVGGAVGHVGLRFTKLEVLQFVMAKSLWLTLHFIYPMSCGNSFGIALRNFFITYMVGAEYMENIFITSHIQPDTVPDNKAHWSVQQCQSTINWGSGSHFWNVFSGGLNHQIEHHLFPSLAYYHYSSISPIVKKACEEHGVPYRNFGSLPTAMFSTFSYLHDLGNNDVPKHQLKTKYT